MNQSSRRGYLKSIGAASAIAGLAGCVDLGLGGDDGGDGELTIGLYGPLSGPAADIGEAMEQGAELAAKEINEDGGILGNEISLTWADSESDPAQGRSAVERLIDQENIDILAGGFHSDVSLSVIEVTFARDVPQMISNSVSGSINQEIEDQSMSNVFKMSPPSQAYGEGWAAFFNDLQEDEVGYFPYEDQSVAMIGEDTSYGISVMDQTEQYLEDEGWSVTSKDTVPVDESDFSSVLSRIQDDDPDIVWAVQTSPAAGGSLIQDFQNTNFEETHFMHTFIPSNPETLEIAGDAANGVLWMSNVDVVPSYAEDVGLTQAWQDEYGVAIPGSSGSLPYDNLYLIKEALEGGLDDIGDLSVDSWESAVIDMEPTKMSSGVFDFDESHQAAWGVDRVPPIAYQIRGQENHSVWPFELAADEIDESLY